MPKRRVIQVMEMQCVGMYALCDDGTLWRSTYAPNEWSEAGQWVLVPTPDDLPAEPPVHVREVRDAWAAQQTTEGDEHG